MNTLEKKSRHEFFEGNMYFYGYRVLSTKATCIALTTVVPAKTSVKCPRYTSFVISFKDRLRFCSETERAKIAGEKYKH